MAIYSNEQRNTYLGNTKMPTYNITAYSNIEKRRVHLFRTTWSPIDAVASAKDTAEQSGRGEELSDFQAEMVK